MYSMCTNNVSMLTYTDHQTNAYSGTCKRDVFVWQKMIKQTKIKILFYGTQNIFFELVKRVEYLYGTYSLSTEMETL